MASRFRQRIARWQAEADEWLEQRPRLARALDYTGCLKGHRQALARGVAAGLFVALTPVFGLQTLFLVIVCVLLHANFPVAFLVSWVSNPFTIGPIVVAANVAGREVVAPLLPALAQAGAAETEALRQVILTLLGSLLIAVPAALLGYLVTLALRRGEGHAA